MKIVIEPAEPEDAAAILRVQKRAYASEAELYQAFDMPPMTETIDQVLEDFEDHELLKATADGRLVGSVRAKTEDHACYIGRLAVDPDFQGRGIGTALMRDVEKLFPEAERFELWAGYKSKRNIHIYEKLGYREVERKEVGNGIFLLYMVKPVKRVDKADVLD